MGTIKKFDLILYICQNCGSGYIPDSPSCFTLPFKTGGKKKRQLFNHALCFTVQYLYLRCSPAYLASHLSLLSPCESHSLSRMWQLDFVSLPFIIS